MNQIKRNLCDKHALNAWLASAAVAMLAGSAAAQDEQFLVMDGNGDRVVRFDWLAGAPEPHDTFVGPGISPLDNPPYAVFGPDGNLYVSSFNNDSVLRYNGVTGKFLGTFVAQGAGGLDGPEGLRFGSDGNLYVASYLNDRVLRYNGLTGQFLSIFVQPGSGGLDAPTDLLFRANGELIVSGDLSDAVHRFNGSTGASLGNLVGTGQATLDRAFGLLEHPDGRVFVTSYNGDDVIVVPAGGGTPVQFITTNLNGPIGLALAPDGSLLVTNQSSNIWVQRFDATSGAFLGTAVANTNSGGISNPVGILFIPELPGPCYADCDTNNVLNIFDYICFSNAYSAGCP